MKPVEIVEVELDKEQIARFECVTDVRLEAGNLIVNHDGEHGPSQTIFAAGWWSKVQSTYRDQPHG